MTLPASVRMGVFPSPGLAATLSPSDGEKVATRPGEVKAPALTDAGKIMGTPNYMAPEPVEHLGEVDHRADIYALGVVFYQMLTGELPGKSMEPPSRKVQIDVRLDEVVMRALEKDPGRRYSQASVLKTQVETIAATPSPKESAGSAPLNSGQEQSAAFQAGAPPQMAAFPASSAQPDLWKRLQRRLWPPLVGRRNGQRVINWPAVAMRGMRGLLVLLVPSVIAGICFGVLTEPSRSIAFGIGCFAGGCIILCFVLTIRILRGFALPPDLVPELDSSAAQPAASSAATPDSSRRRGDESQTPKVPQSLMSRLGLVALGLLVLAILAALLLPVYFKGGTRHEVHYRVFEVESALADKLVPAAQRQNGATGNWQVSDISPETLAALLDGRVLKKHVMIDRRRLAPTSKSPSTIVTTRKPGVKDDQQEVVVGWPIVSDNWGHSLANHVSDDIVQVSGHGFFGVRRKDGVLQLRIKHAVTHKIGDHPEVDVNISHEGDAPRAEALAFFIPFARRDDTT